MSEEQIRQKAKDFVSKIASGTSKEMDYYADILTEFATEATKELEEENAELKEYNKYLKRQRQGGIQKQYNKVAIIKQQNEKLTKAKKIIKTLLRLWNDVMTEETVKALIAEAEQFLKGESTTPNECHDCAKFDEMPKGPRCKTCDNGSHFQKKEEA